MSRLNRFDALSEVARRLTEQIQLGEDAKTEIMSELLGFVYYRNLLIKLQKSLKKLDIPFLNDNPNVVKLLWMIYIFLQNSLFKKAGNLAEALNLIGAVILTFLERLKLINLPRKSIDDQLISKLLSSLKITSQESFLSLLIRTREQLVLFTTQRLIPQEFTSFDQIAHHLSKFEVLYRKQLDSQEIDMTYFFRYLTPVLIPTPTNTQPHTPNPKSQTPNLQHKLKENSILMFSPTIQDTLKVTPSAKRLNSPKTAKRTAQKDNMDIAEVESAVKRELKGVIETAEVRSLARFAGDAVKKTNSIICESVVDQRKVLEFHLMILKEVAKHDPELMFKLQSQDSHFLFFAFTVLLYSSSLCLKPAPHHSLLKSLRVSPLDLLTLIESNSTLSQSIPKNLSPFFIELRKKLLTFLVWSSQSFHEREKKIDSSVLKAAEQRTSKLVATILDGIEGGRSELKTAIEICSFVLNERISFLNRKHLDQLAICAIYATFKLHKKRLKFRQILVEYKRENPDQYGEVIYPESSGDIITLYNQEFVPLLSDLRGKLAEDHEPSEIPFSPATPPSPQLQQKALPVDAKSRRVLDFDLRN